MTLNDAIQRGCIPNKYVELLRNKLICPHCRSEIEVSDNLTQMYCSNPICGNKVAARYLAALRDLNIKGIGEVSTLNIVQYCKFDNIVDALKSEYSRDVFLSWASKPRHPSTILALLNLPGLNSGMSDKLFSYFSGWNEIKQARNIKYGYWAFPSLLGPEKEHPDREPSQSERTKVIFEYLTKPGFMKEFPFERFMNEIVLKYYIPQQEYTCYEDIVDILSYKGLFYHVLCALGGTGASATNVTDVLIQFWDEIELMFKQCKPISARMQEIIICITGQTSKSHKLDGSAFERVEFVDYLNNMFNPYMIRVKNGKALASCKYTVADYPSNSRSYENGLARGNLISSSGLIKMLADKVSCGDEEMARKITSQLLLSSDDSIS